MVIYKTDDEILKMQEGGKKLRQVIEKVIPFVHPDVCTMEIDKRIEQEIIKQGAEPSFKKVPGYKWSICAPINDQIVHTPPGPQVIKNGDVLTIDFGVFFKGFHTDFATTILVGETQPRDIVQFLKVGKEALNRAINATKEGNRIGDISQVIQEAVQENGYFVIHSLTGHGIGTDLHEDPFIPGYIDRPIKKTEVIKPGMVLALEVIYSMGTTKMMHEKGDGWSIVTQDGSISACFEHTVAVTSKNTMVLT